jgi:hypothetical protein
VLQRSYENAWAHQEALFRLAQITSLREVPEDFKGGLSVADYASTTGAFPATATRNLAYLWKSALCSGLASGDMRLWLAIAATQVYLVLIDERGNVSEPQAR